MSTLPTLASVAAVTTKPVSLLSHVGQFFLRVFHVGEEVVGVGEKVATAAAPIVAVAFPEVGPLYITTLGLVQTVEAAYASTSGSGAQKLAMVLQQLTPKAEAWFSENKIPFSVSALENYVNAVVASLNALPAPKA